MLKTSTQVRVGLTSTGLSAHTMSIFLGLHALETQETIFRDTLEGYLLAHPDEILQKLAPLLPEHQVLQRGSGHRKKMRRMRKFDFLVTDEDEPSDMLVIWDGGYFELERYAKGMGRLEIDTTDEELLDKMLEMAEPLFEEKGAKARVSAIVNSGNRGLTIVDVGESKNALNRGNYSEKILQVFDHLVKEIGTATPCGRLSIFTGTPGTGKTYFLEGLTLAQPRARYLLLPSSLVPSLTGPELLRCLTQEMDEENDLPIVFLIEDADECLVNRQADNLPAISTLLNLADGILGRCLDVRVLATSNAKTQEIDKALLRTGRLCRSAHFESLSAEHAQAVYKRLHPEGTTVFSKATPLADVYHAAHVEQVGE